jgi:hypothetical protein
MITEAFATEMMLDIQAEKARHPNKLESTDNLIPVTTESTLGADGKPVQQLVSSPSGEFMFPDYALEHYNTAVITMATSVIMQGDLTLLPVGEIPLGAVKFHSGTVVRATSNALYQPKKSPHCHEIFTNGVEPVVMMTVLTGSGQVEMYVQVNSPGVLAHPEHKAVLVPPSSYIVRFQQAAEAGVVVQQRD